MRFSHGDYEKLISLVRKHQCLYNTTLVGYKNIDEQKAAWKSIADEMGHTDVTITDWKKMWRSKRDHFIKKRKELHNTSSEEEAKKILKSPYYLQMTFLCDYISSSNLSPTPRSHQNVPDMDDSYSIHINPEDLDIEVSDDSETPRSNFSENALAEDSTSQQSSKKRKREEDDSDGSDGSDGFIAQLNKQSLANYTKATELMISKLSGEEEDDNFLFFIAKKFKTFSPSVQDWLEEESMKLYREAKRRQRLATDTASSETSHSHTETHSRDEPLAISSP